MEYNYDGDQERRNKVDFCPCIGHLKKEGEQTSETIGYKI
jgi:hypothetical protein